MGNQVHSRIAEDIPDIRWGVSLDQLGLASTYKYKPQISRSEKQRILEKLYEIALKTNIPVLTDAVIGLPPHLNSENSFPWEVANYFSLQLGFDDLSSHFVEKKPLMNKIKDTPIASRNQEISGNYAFEGRFFGSSPRGILLLDDFYESGSTLRSFATFVKSVFPDAELYAMTMYRKR